MTKVTSVAAILIVGVAGKVKCSVFEVYSFGYMYSLWPSNSSAVAKQQLSCGQVKLLKCCYKDSDSHIPRQ